MTDPTPWDRSSGSAIPPLTDAERAVAAEAHGIPCTACDESFLWEQYAEHLEDRHARGAGVTVRPAERSFLGDVWDVSRGLVLLAGDWVRRRR